MGCDEHHGRLLEFWGLMGNKVKDHGLRYIDDCFEYKNLGIKRRIDKKKGSRGS